jgi:hypothetical protein
MTDAEYMALVEKVGAIESALINGESDRDLRRGILDGELRSLKEALEKVWKAIDAQRLKLFGNGTPEGSVCYELGHHREAIADLGKDLEGHEARLKLLEDQDKRITALESKAKLPGQALALILQLLTLATLAFALWPK